MRTYFGVVFAAAAAMCLCEAAPSKKQACKVVNEVQYVDKLETVCQTKYE